MNIFVRPSMRVAGIFEAVTNEYCFISKDDVSNEMTVGDFVSIKFHASTIASLLGCGTRFRWNEFKPCSCNVRITLVWEILS